MFFQQPITSILATVSANTLLSHFLDSISSKGAIIGYVMILLILLAILVIFILSDSRKRAENPNITITTMQDAPVPMGTPQNGVQAAPAPTQTVETATANATPTEETASSVAAAMPVANDKNNVPEGASRFCMLSRIDANKAKYKEKSYHTDITLKKFCDDFRNYASYKLNLYYHISDIRAFVAGMAVSQILILQGMSGTGKTSLAHAMGSFLENTSTVIPVQPMWKERTDLLGYYNEFTKRFNETLLLEKMYEANYSEDIYVTVLDEMNIARVEYYFAEFLSLLELPDPDERYIDVVSDIWSTDPLQFKNGRLKLPYNMWFIGTANNDDSTFAISDKVYDRAMVLNLDEKCERFTAPKTKNIHMSAEHFRALVKEALKEYEITGRNLQRLEALDKYLIEHFHITFGNRIMKQIRQYIPVYVSCGGTELEALDDILSKKIIRKLETQNPVYLRNASKELRSYINELFGEDAMPLCQNAIRRLELNA